MKKTSLYLIFLGFHWAVAFGQKHDNNWIQGTGLTNDAPLSQTMLVTFDQSPPTIAIWPVSLDFNATTLTVSDEEGKLIFFTNGIKIHDANDNLMLGGDSLNAGQLAYENWEHGYSAFEGIQALPTGNDIYYLFHVRGEWVTAPVVPDLLGTVVDMKGNGGLGEVIQKNLLIKKGQNFEFPAATRHANGRDWWVATPELFKNQIFTCLISPSGVSDTAIQTIGYKPMSQDSIGIGQNLFSPDGATYVDVDQVNGVRIYDFDRCNGQFNNFRTLNSAVAPKPLGAAISPNSRFLYIGANDGKLILQFDLYTNDIESSVETVAIYDGFMQGPFESIFTIMRLAPDGKIYINSYTRHFHVINNPDIKGLGCDVKQHYLPLPQEPSTIPVYPNYRLGPIDGSPCDTLGLDATAVGEVQPKQAPTTYSILPNPAGETLTLQSKAKFPANANWELYDSLGKKVKTIALIPEGQNQPIPLDGLSAGAYFYVVKVEGRMLQSGKFIIQR